VVETVQFFPQAEASNSYRWRTFPATMVPLPVFKEPLCKL
jgi:hypothetical protein